MVIPILIVKIQIYNMYLEIKKEDNYKKEVF